METEDTNNIPQEAFLYIVFKDNRVQEIVRNRNGIYDGGCRYFDPKSAHQTHVVRPATYGTRYELMDNHGFLWDCYSDARDAFEAAR